MSFNDIDIVLKQRTKMFLYHGEDDPTIPLAGAEFSYEEFKQHGLNYTLTTEPGLEHTVSPKMISKVSKFFKDNMRIVKRLKDIPV